MKLIPNRSLAHQESRDRRSSWGFDPLEDRCVPAGLPDLRGVSFEILEPDARWGEIVTLEYSIENHGGMKSGAFLANLRLSTNSVIGPGDVNLGNLSISSIDAGAETHGRWTVQLPGSPDTPPSGFPLPGSVYLGWILDADNRVIESDESNNSNRGEGLDYGKLSITVAPETLSDLLIIAVSGPSIADPGSTITLEVTVRNAGGSSAPSSHYGAYLSKDRHLSAGDHLLSTVSFDSLESMEEIQTSITFAIPDLADLPALSANASDPLYIVFVVDESDAVTEGDEDNNRRDSADSFPLQVNRSVREDETNNAQPEAEQATLNSVLFGRADSRDDEDWYRFETTEFGRVELFAANPGDAVPWMMLAAEDGTAIVANVMNVKGDLDPLQVYLQPGTHWLRLRKDEVGAKYAVALRFIPTLSPYDSTRVPGNASILATADFDRDGWSDLLIVDPNSSLARIAFGTGLGDLSPYSEITLSSGPTAVTVGDLDNDGMVDIAVADSGLNSVVLFYGEGDGKFRRHTNTIAVGRTPEAILAEDLNGDGILDLLTANATDNTISVILGRSDGTFRPVRKYATGQSPQGIAVVKDGASVHSLRIAVTNYADNGVTLFDVDDFGILTQVREITVSRLPDRIIAGDIDRDGWSDLVVAGSGDNRIDVLWGNSLGTFTRLQLSNADVRFGEPASLQLGDVDDDGDLDIVVADGASGHFTVLYVESRRILQSRRSAVNDQLVDIQFLDLDQDDRLDVVTLSASSDGLPASLTVRKGLDGGRFEEAPSIATVGPRAALYDGDIDGDGVVDLLAIGDGAVSVFRGDGNGGFSDEIVTEFQKAISISDRVAVLDDFNRDGRLDLLVAAFFDGTFQLLLGRSDGTFLPLRTDETEDLGLVSGPRPFSLTSGDVNNDGLLDLIVGNSSAGAIDQATVRILLNRAGQYELAQTITLPKSFSALASEPFAIAVDRDGGTIGVVDDLQRSVSILTRQLDGTFVVSQTVQVGQRPVAIANADINADGQPDFAVADSDDSIQLILSGTSGWALSTSSLDTAANSFPRSIATGDFNDDRRVDLVVANRNSGSVLILTQQEDGSFSSRFLDVGSQPDGVVVTDFNSDGIEDVGLTLEGSSEIVVLLGNATGDFVFAYPKREASVDFAPCFDDFNGDGIKDLVSLSERGAILFRAGIAGQPGVFRPSVILNEGFRARDIAVQHLGNRRALVALNTSPVDVDSNVVIYTWNSGRWKSIPVDVASSLVDQVATADLDADGIADDLILGSRISSAVTLLTFSEVNVASAQVALPGPSNSILVVDSIGGQTRILFENSAASEIYTLSGTEGDWQIDRQRTSAEAPIVDALALRSTSSSEGVVQVFMNGDMLADLLISQPASRQLFLIIGGQGGSFRAPVFIANDVDVFPIGAVDLNQDGRTDVVAFDRDDETIRIFLMDNNGSFAESTGLIGRVSLAGSEGRGFTLAQTNDDNRDGRIDTRDIADLVVSSSQGDILVLEGDGKGSFRPYRRTERASQIAAADFDGDGKTDYVLANPSSDRVRIQFSGLGTPYQQTRDDQLRRPSSAQPTDLDGDGITDLVVANTAGNNVLIYLGLGNGIFADPLSYFVGTAPTAITVGNLNDDNGDGRVDAKDLPDLVVSNSGSNDLSILLGTISAGAWTLTLGPRLDAGTSPTATSIDDINDDGIPDLFIANDQGNNAAVLTGLGNGFFNDANPSFVSIPGVILPQPNPVPGATVVSFDNATGNLTFLSDLQFVNGTLQFGSRRSFTSGNVDPVSAALRDFDRDGNLDLVVLNRGRGDVSLLASRRDRLDLVTTIDVADIGLASSLALGALADDRLTFYVCVDGDERVEVFDFVFSDSVVESPTNPERAAETRSILFVQFRGLLNVFQGLVSAFLNAGRSSGNDGDSESLVNASSFAIHAERTNGEQADVAEAVAAFAADVLGTLSELRQEMNRLFGRIIDLANQGLHQLELRTGLTVTIEDVGGVSSNVLRLIAPVPIRETIDLFGNFLKVLVIATTQGSGSSELTDNPGDFLRAPHTADHLEKSQPVATTANLSTLADLPVNESTATRSISSEVAKTDSNSEHALDSFFEAIQEERWSVFLSGLAAIFGPASGPKLPPETLEVELPTLQNERNERLAPRKEQGKARAQMPGTLGVLVGTSVLLSRRYRKERGVLLKHISLP